MGLPDSALGLGPAEWLSLARRDDESGVRPCSCMDLSLLHGTVDALIGSDGAHGAYLEQFVAAAELACEPGAHRCGFSIPAAAPAGRLLAAAKELVSAEGVAEARRRMLREHESDAAQQDQNPHLALARLWASGWGAAQVYDDPGGLLVDPDSVGEGKALLAEARNAGVRAGLAWKSARSDEGNG